MLYIKYLNLEFASIIFINAHTKGRMIDCYQKIDGLKSSSLMIAAESPVARMTNSPLF